MRKDFRLGTAPIWGAVLLILLVVSVWLPSAREMHGLCLRMLLHLRGETLVQGQPPGCMIYTVPNVVFTDQRRAELRKASTNSPDSYVLASSAGEYSKLESPPGSAWTKHVLSKWGALQLSRIATESNGDKNESKNTNEPAPALGEIALRLVRHAQLVEPTNGTFWLAEAALQFAKKDDVSALVALGTAASNNVWRADTENTFTNMSSLFLRAGFSKLDAATAANILSPATPTLVLQAFIKRNLGRLMETAVRSNDDSQFNRLLQLIVELRKASWDEKSEEFPNSFRSFRVTDELMDAMAGRIGVVVPPVSKLDEPDTFEARRKLRPQVFQDFLECVGEVKTVARFYGQADSNNAIRSLRKELVRVQTRSVMLTWAISSVAGLLASLLLALLIIGVLSELPFWWLRKSTEAFGCWPRNGKFWLTAIAAVALGTFLFTSAQLAVGLNSKVGLQLVSEPEGMSPEAESFAVALAVCAVWFGALVSIRRTAKQPVDSWLFVASIAAIYCIVIIVAGIFRDRTAELIESALF